MQQRRVRRTLLPQGAASTTPLSGEKRGRSVADASGCPVVDLALPADQTSVDHAAKQLAYGSAEGGSERGGGGGSCFSSPPAPAPPGRADVDHDPLASPRTAPPRHDPLSGLSAASGAAAAAAARSARSPSAKRVRIEGFADARDAAPRTAVTAPLSSPERLRPQNGRAQPYTRLGLFEPRDGARSGGQELVVLVGAPSSGKTYLAKRLFAPRGYSVVSHARVGASRDKVAAFVASALDKGQSVVVDAANPDAETRAVYTHAAARQRVAARCVYMATELGTAKQLDMMRCEADAGAVPVPEQVFDSYAARFAPPSLAEDFVEVRTVFFYPDGAGVGAGRG